MRVFARIWLSSKIFLRNRDRGRSEIYKKSNKNLFKIVFQRQYFVVLTRCFS